MLFRSKKDPNPIDADDGTVVILAAGDIFSTAIEGIDSLRAEAKGNVSLTGDVTAESSIDIEAAGDITTRGLEAGSPTADDASIRVKSTDGDVKVLYLSAKGRSDASIVAIAGGDDSDLTIIGDNIHGAVSAKANNVHNADEANADICLQAGDDITINGKVEAEAHGKKADRKSVV